MAKPAFFIKKSMRFVYVGVVFGLSLTACDMHHPTYFGQEKIRVEQEKFVEEGSYAALNEQSLAGLAQHYDRHGEGPFSVTVTYDPRSKSNTAMRAGEKAAELASILRRQGVQEVETNIMPVQGQVEPKVIVSYIGYNALAPKDCELMPGIESRNVEAEVDYKMGCSLDTIFARQIARPKDLVGQRGVSDADGRRSANQIERYRTGVPNEALGGETASE